MSWRGSFALIVLPMAACLSAIRSTEGGRREARRECLQYARNEGWHVIDIGAAVFRGTGRYDVDLLVSRDSVPQQAVRCVYDIRAGVSHLTSVDEERR